MDHVVGSCCCFIQSTFNTEVGHNIKAASRRSSGQRLVAWVVAKYIGFCGTANDNANIVVILQCLLKDSKTTETSGSRKHNSFCRHVEERSWMQKKYEFSDRKRSWRNRDLTLWFVRTLQAVGFPVHIFNNLLGVAPPFSLLRVYWGGETCGIPKAGSRTIIDPSCWLSCVR